MDVIPPATAKRSTTGITIIEILVVCCFIACGVALAHWLWARFGAMWGLFGLPVGVLLGLIGWLLLSRLVGIWYRFFPVRPVCQRGRCHEHDYKVVRVVSAYETVFQCACGDMYVRRNREFARLLSDGSTKPYMAFDGFPRRWKPVADEQNRFREDRSASTG